MGSGPGEFTLASFDRLNVWSRGDQRAPHKPLLVLYALGRWSRGESGDIAFRDAEPVLTSLLKEFGFRSSFGMTANAMQLPLCLVLVPYT
jgi:predicted restriction endonuclease